MRRILFGSSALLIATLALAGCSAASGGSGDTAGGYSNPNVAAPAEGGAVNGSGGGSAADAGSGSIGDQTKNREQIVTGDVTITADDPLKASREAVRIVETAGGRVDGRTEYAARDGDKGSAQLLLRIPADKLTATLDKLKELGKTESVALSTTDVTVQSQDLDARIDALKATIDRLNVLVAKATNIDDLIKLEGEISTRQGDLESLEAQKRDLADQVSMSSVNLYLQSVATAPKVTPGDFWSGLATGWGAFVAFWAGLLVVLGVLLPWIVTAGIIAFVIVFIVRRRRSRAEAAALAAQPAPPTGSPSPGEAPTQTAARTRAKSAKP